MYLREAKSGMKGSDDAPPIFSANVVTPVSAKEKQIPAFLWWGRKPLHLADGGTTVMVSGWLGRETSKFGLSLAAGSLA